MRRREFITLLGGTATAWPLAARAQQSAMPVIGFLSPSSPEAHEKFVAGFRKGLGEAGYVDGRNVAIEYRWAYGESGRLLELAADLVSRKVSVIAAPGGVAAALAAKAATATVPIVFVTGSDPVADGLVVSLNRPGGNVTGITSMNTGLAVKQLGLLQQLLHRDARFAVLVNPKNPQTQFVIANLQAAASAMGRQVEILTASTKPEITPAFSDVVQKRADALLISADPLFASRPVQLATLADRRPDGRRRDRSRIAPSHVGIATGTGTARPTVAQQLFSLQGQSKLRTAPFADARAWRAANAPLPTSLTTEKANGAGA